MNICPNTPERLREIQQKMEAEFGPETTKSSLGRTLHKEDFDKLYPGEGEQIDETGEVK